MDSRSPSIWLLPTPFLMLLVLLLLLGYPAGLNAQGDAGSPPPTTGADPLVSQDFINRLMFGFSMVFVLIIGYLIVSHRRSKLRSDDLRFLERRLQDLEARS